MSIRILKLAFQDHRAGIAVGGPFLETVIFLHGLVIQILAIYHKEDLIDIRKLRSLTSGLEGRQCLAGAGRVPDISAAGYSAIFLIIIGDLDPVHDPLSRRDLIRPHDHEHVLRCEDAIFGQDIQDRMSGKKGPGKIDQIRNYPVVCIGPEAGELKAVTGLFFLLLA